MRFVNLFMRSSLFPCYRKLLVTLLPPRTSPALLSSTFFRVLGQAERPTMSCTECGRWMWLRMSRTKRLGQQWLKCSWCNICFCTSGCTGPCMSEQKGGEFTKMNIPCLVISFPSFHIPVHQKARQVPASLVSHVQGDASSWPVCISEWPGAIFSEFSV